MGLMIAAIDYFNAAGGIVVAAAGNENYGGDDVYPSCYPGVVSVAALDTYWAPVTWSDAMDYCATYGKTLCGSSDAARCQNKGCYYNSIYQWTNEPCEPGDEGYECTTP